MRKWNAVLGMGMIALFVMHTITGVMQLTGLIAGGGQISKYITHLMMVVIAAHAVIGVILTGRTIAAQRRSGVAYRKENKLFWTRRISGFAIMLFVIHHMQIFHGHTSGGGFRLNLFARFQLVSSVLLVVSVAVHVITNIKPLFIALGLKSMRQFALDILLVISVILLVAGAAFVLYYLRWAFV